MSKALFKRYIKEKQAKSAHAVLSASGAERWLGCPGSIRMSEGITSVDTEWSVAGTNAHTLLQFILENENDYDGLLQSKDATAFKEHIGFSSEQYAVVRLAARHVWATRLALRSAGSTPTLLVEQKVELAQVGFGTADVILYQPFGELHVMDYKNGKSVVEPEGNQQMLYYACAAADRFGWDFESAHLTIIQPNAVHRNGPIRTWVASQRVLVEAGKRFVKGATLTRDEKAPLVLNDKWCWFCPARSKCPEQMRIKERTIMAKFTR